MPAYPNPIPSWLYPENASVLDSPLRKVIRAISNANPLPERLEGALPNPNPFAMMTDPLSQVLAVMGGMRPGRSSQMELFKPTKPAPQRAYHGSPSGRRVLPDPELAVETKGASFLASNKDVADTFTIPREYGEQVFGAREGKVTALDVSLRRPYVMKGDEAERFIEDTAFQGKVIAQAKSAGYDGAIAKDVMEGVGERYRGDVYAIFNRSGMKFPPRKRPTSAK
jgi:hypothetical protein|tara:strand:- start:1283 stop:1957 length:675 start_codon:yes stop_codon:yes gene_type:complete